MKAIVIFALCLLAGCTVSPTLEQLEADALASGDWSAVERREAAIKRRQNRYGIQCPVEYIGYCVSRPGSTDCRCILRNSFVTMGYR